MTKLRFLCAYCPAKFEQIKQLFDHYENEHRNRGFKRYKIRHLPSGNVGMASAPTPEEACSRVCWDFKECEVRELRKGEKV